MKIIYISLLLFTLPVFAADFQSAIQKSNLQNLSSSLQWEKFLHYYPTILGKRSDIDSSSFFLAKSGYKNKHAELSAFLKALYLNKKTRCNFPARVKWLIEKKIIPDSFLEFKHCKKYNDFYKKAHPKSVYIVFSSYYLESPASAFGHTFFRFSTNQNFRNDKRNELLDTGISYGATVTTKNPALYALFGLIGAFEGNYSLLPYFYKIREYNDFEARDLWSYQLNLTEKQKIKLVDHLWEVANSWSSYFFFSENCSYNILTLLEAVNPEWELISNLPHYVIPADTLKILYTIPGFVKGVTFRPSVKKVFLNSIEQLSNIEKKLLSKIIDLKDLLLLDSSNISEQENSHILDALIDYLDYKHSTEILEEKGEFFDWKLLILKRRAVLNVTPLSQDVPLPELERPETAHPSRRINVGLGNKSSENNYLSAGFRFALHDLQDPIQGSPQYAGISFFKTNFRYYTDQNQLLLQELAFVDVFTLNPWEYKHYPISLRAKAYISNKESVNGENSLIPYLLFSSGLTTVLKNRYIFSTFINTELSYSKNYQYKDGKLAIGPSILLLTRWTQALNNRFEISWNYMPFQEEKEWSFEHEMRVPISKEISIQIQNSKSSGVESHSINLLYYL